MNCNQHARQFLASLSGRTPTIALRGHPFVITSRQLVTNRTRLFWGRVSNVHCDSICIPEAIDLRPQVLPSEYENMRFIPGSNPSSHCQNPGSLAWSNVL